MRTTLKKGIGRGAEVNGNARAVIPPGALSPVSLYRQSPPARPGLAKVVFRFFLWLAVVVVMLVTSFVGGVYLWAHDRAAASRKREPATERTLDAIKNPHKAAIALVIGYDHRAGDQGAPSRSDTMMLIRADPVDKTLSLLSFPRDLDVPIYCPGRTASGASNGPPVVVDHGRINSAFALCGSRGSIDTVKQLTGLPINYLIRVNFLGFIAAVNKLGGVWMDVDRRYYNKNIGTSLTDYANIDLQPGYQLLTGKKALDFVRFRHTDSDLFRLARQQEFVTAERQQIARSLGPTSLIGLVNTITSHHYLEIVVGSGNQYDLGTIYSYAKFVRGLPPGHVFQVKISNVTGYNELYASQDSINQAVQSFLNPDVQESKAATAVALGRKLKKTFTLPPSSVTLTVLNGNGVAGSAGNASYLLGQKGYKVLLPPSGLTANAPTWDYFHSKAYFDQARAANCKAAAGGIGRLVGSTDVEPMPAKIKPLSNGACVVLVVGSTFHSRLAPVIVPTAPTHHSPNIRVDPNESRATLAKYKRRMPFRLQLPTVLERGSYLDTCCGDTPARAYALGGRPTVRLTYKTGTNEYWGIQETDWLGAPVLLDKSLTQWVGRRRYDLYYSAGDLHMVVLRTGGASSWVVNTLLNSLSNETMLAIARGLRPMTR